MKKLITLTTLLTLFVSCNIQEIEEGLADKIEDSNLLTASCDLSNYEEPSGATYTNISSSNEPSTGYSSSTNYINEGVSSQSVYGKCSVIRLTQSCPTCRFVPLYSVEYIGDKDQDSDACRLNDGTVVTIDLSDKQNPSCSSAKRVRVVIPDP